MILKKIGIYGWSEQLENILFASLLTGDPLLMVGVKGTAKTGLAVKIGEAMKIKFHAYDASKALFEDVLGYPNVEKLKQGVVEYLSSKVTVWDKQFILIDELNRALLEMQNKWLEIIRSRKIMGFETAVRWVWSAMNPMTYAGTSSLDEALVGRFSWFIYVPEVLDMSEEDRIKVTEEINGDDAPSLDFWQEKSVKSISTKEISEAGNDIKKILKKAARIFVNLKKEMRNLSEFLSRFSILVDKESKGELKLDGRRLGFIHRNILSKRAVEVAKSLLFNEKTIDFKESAKEAIISSIPAGISQEGLNTEQLQHTVEIVFDVLAPYFEDKGDIQRISKIYELFTTDNVVRKAEILLKEKLGDFVHTKAWNDIVTGDTDQDNVKLVSLIAMQLEAKKPGTVPKEMIDSLGSKLKYEEMTVGSIGRFGGKSVNVIKDLEKYLESLGEIESVIAIDKIKKYMNKFSDKFDKKKVAVMKDEIDDDIKTFYSLISEVKNEKSSNMVQATSQV